MKTLTECFLDFLDLCFLFNINNVKKIKLRLAYLRYVLSRNVFKKEIDISPGVTEIFTRRGGGVVKRFFSITKHG